MILFRIIYLANLAVRVTDPHGFLFYNIEKRGAK